MISKNRLSKFLSLQSIPNKQLSIQFSLDGFSFCIFNLDLLEFIAYGNYKFENKDNNPEVLLNNVQTVFEEELMLKEKFNKVQVIHQNNLATFVPNALFDKNSLKEYLKFNNKIYTTDYIVYDALLSQEFSAIYVPYVNINNFLIDQYGSFEYRHFSSVLVEELLNNYSNKESFNLFVNISDFNFEIVYIKKNELQLYNTFTYKTKEDFIYYILFTIEQLKIDVETVSLQFLGAISEKDVFFKIAYKYIRNVKLLTNLKKYNTIKEIDEVLLRENFTLFNTIK